MDFKTERHVLNLNQPGDHASMITEGDSIVAIQGVLISGTKATAVVTLERRISAVTDSVADFVALETPHNLADGEIHDITNFMGTEIRARVSTVEGADGEFEVTFMSREV